MTCRCRPQSRAIFRAHVVDAPSFIRRVASDPTGTMPLQRRFKRDMDVRWMRLRRMLPDALMSKLDAINSISHATMTGQDQVRAFQSWLDGALQTLVLGTNGSWTLPYVRGAGDIGLVRARALNVQPTGTINDRTPQLQTLCITELQGIMEAVSQQCVRALANGLLLKQTPSAIARSMQQVIDKTGKSRSDLLISFIVVRTFGAATLDSFRAAGIPTVGTIAERTGPTNSPHPIGLVRDAAKKKSKVKKKKKKWADLVEVLTAGDDDVCPACEDISEEGPYTLDEAEMLIPAHPRCRCAFVPWGDARFAHDEWNEADHPRDKDGKFAVKGTVGEKLSEIEKKLNKLGVPMWQHEVDPDPDSKMHLAVEVPTSKGEYFIEQAEKHGLEVNEQDPADFGQEDEEDPHSFFTVSNKTEPAHQPNSSIDMSLMTKVGEAKGSNPGGVYENEFGSKYYIKEPKTPEHVANELLAAKLYQAAGSQTMQYVPVKGDAHVATVLEPLDKNNVSQLDDLQRQAAQKDFAIHAWLANWDAVGTGGDNQVVPKGTYWPVTVDVGGSMLFRAQGEPKGDAFGDKVTEINTLRDPASAPDAAALYGNMTNDEIAASIKRVTNIPNEKITNLVHSHMPDNWSAETRAALASKLIARKNDLAKQAIKMSTAPVPTKVAELSPDDKTMYASLEQQVAATGAGFKTFGSEPTADPEPKTFKTKMEHAKHLLMKGTTSEELKKALNWPAIGVPATAAQLNLKLEKTKQGKSFFYKGTPMTPDEIKAAKGAGKEVSKVSAQVVEIKTAAPTVSKWDTNKPNENFMEALENQGIKAKMAPLGSHGDYFISLDHPKDIATAAAVAKWHPKIKMISGHEFTYTAPSASTPAAPPSTPATPDELKKAQKNTKLTAQYVPGAPANNPEAQKLIDKFNEKYEGKVLSTNEELQAKVDAFKKLQADMVPLMSAQQKVEAEKAAKLKAEQAAALAKANAPPDFDNMTDEEERLYWYKKTTGNDGDYLVKAESVVNGTGAKSKKLQDAGVTVAEVAYIKAFTGPFSDVNEQMRKGFMSEDVMAFKHIMIEGLAKFPKYDGDTVWRKIQLTGMQQAAYEAGMVVHWQAFSSTAKNPDTWSGNTHFTIRNPKSGVDVEFISSNPSEAEVIMPADTYYKVLSKKTSGGVTHIEMEEVLPFGKKKKKAA